MKTAAVVLAAGKSERMGSNKLLLEVAGHPILYWILKKLVSSSVDEIIVVLGHKPEELRPLVETHRAKVVHNLNYEKGMTGSFQVGLNKASAEAVFLVLGDQPGLNPEILDRMKEKMASNPDALIVSPVYEDARGHPVLFRKAIFDEILGLSETETLRDVVDRHQEVHIHIEGDRLCTMDVDTQEDFESIKRLFETHLGAESL